MTTRDKHWYETTIGVASGQTYTTPPLRDRMLTDSPQDLRDKAHPEFLKILDKMLETHVNKGADYGSATDTFANVKASEEFGIRNYVGVCLRMNDKMQRIKQFVRKGSLRNESFEDALLDLASYSIIALILYKEEKNA